jgi:hypothetical protein
MRGIKTILLFQHRTSSRFESQEKLPAVWVFHIELFLPCGYPQNTTGTRNMPESNIRITLKYFLKLFPVYLSTETTGISDRLTLYSSSWRFQERFSRHYLTCCPWSHGYGIKSFKLVWQCHQLLAGFLAKGHLSAVSRQSCSSDNEKGDNYMIPRGCAQISWHLSYSWGKPRKTLARRPSMKAVLVSRIIKW